MPLQVSLIAWPMRRLLNFVKARPSPVRHLASAEFWYHYRNLPDPIRDLADKNFALRNADPRHPSLRLKKVGKYYSARIGLAFRALGVEIPDGILWFWIGDHAEYERLIR